MTAVEVAPSSHTEKNQSKIETHKYMPLKMYTCILFEMEENKYRKKNLIVLKVAFLVTAFLFRR